MSVGSVAVRIDRLAQRHHGVGRHGFREGEAHHRGLTGGDGDAGGLRAVALVPGLHHVIAGREHAQIGAPVHGRDPVEGVVQHAHIGAHPAVDVAAHRNHHLRQREAAVGVHVHRLTDVEAAVLAGRGVDVVGQAVRVAEGQVLARLHTHDAGHVAAADLVHDHRAARGGEAHAGVEAFPDIDEDVGQAAAVTHHDLLGRRRIGVPGRAIRLGRHVDRIHLGRHALEHHHRVDATRGSHVDGGSHLLAGGLFLHAAAGLAATATAARDREHRSRRHHHGPAASEQVSHSFLRGAI